MFTCIRSCRHVASRLILRIASLVLWPNFFCATADIQETASDRAWSDVKKVVDNVHKHVCGHATLSDMQKLLERNNLWNREVGTYLKRIVNSCSNCARFHVSKKARKESLSTVNRSFNEFACIDYFHLGNMRICLIMDAATCYSVGAAETDIGMESSINVFYSHWISHFWAPNSIQFDQAFDDDIFRNFFNLYGIEFRPITVRRHNKNVTESKHKIIRDIFIRLESEFYRLLKLCVLNRQLEFQMICTEIKFVLHMS